MGALLFSSSLRTRIFCPTSLASLLVRCSSRYRLEETVERNWFNRFRLSIIESIRLCPDFVRQKRRRRWMKKKMKWLKLRMMTNAFLKKKEFYQYFLNIGLTINKLQSHVLWLIAIDKMEWIGRMSGMHRSKNTNSIWSCSFVKAYWKLHYDFCVILSKCQVNCNDSPYQ